MNERVDCLVVGSGPGAAVTGFHLAEAGRDVLMLEEGSDTKLETIKPFSQEEIIQRYRNAGITLALGKTTVAYAEGSCLGGGSEVNSALYHRLPNEVLDQWKERYQVQGLEEGELNAHFEWIESEVGVAELPYDAPLASTILAEGAKAKQWKCQEVSRFYQYLNENGELIAKKNSMSLTLLPRYLEKGGKLECGAKVLGFERLGCDWKVCFRKEGELREVVASNLFIGAGAVHTPYLLRRSGISTCVGNQLQLHPMLKVVAKFPEAVNHAEMGVGVHQVKEFSPLLSFGCSISSLPFLAIGLIDYPRELAKLRENWQNMAVYYVQLSGDSLGSVRCLPKTTNPLVRYHLTKADNELLALGLSRLSSLLLSVGARELY